MSERLSLFLLDTVLFPTMQLPLQVFEPRYLEMVRKCLDGESVFGVNLIRSGPEVGGDAEPVECADSAVTTRTVVRAAGRSCAWITPERRPGTARRAHPASRPLDTNDQLG